MSWTNWLFGFGADRKDGIDEIPKNVQEATPEQMLEWVRQAADMRLRDEFAKAAMAEFIKVNEYRDSTFQRLSEASYLMADAMLAARKNEKGE
jgi:hypothetical protein